MPANFLHSVFPYLINKWKTQFILPALLVGSIIPDIEVIPLYYFTNGKIDRLIFHSIIGAITIGTLLTILLVMIFYPIFVSLIFKIRISEIKEKCHFSTMLIISSIIGNLSHVLIDATSHEYNPLLYPLSSESINFFRISDNLVFDYQIINVILVIIFILILFTTLRKGLRGFWKRMLLGPI
jgi:membrane-bound metal-dependent hydrolase YbcI (DUF457 family)